MPINRKDKETKMRLDGINIKIEQNCEGRNLFDDSRLKSATKFLGGTQKCNGLGRPGRFGENGLFLNWKKRLFNFKIRIFSKNSGKAGPMRG
jgi:hypothetical protein